MSLTLDISPISVIEHAIEYGHSEPVCKPVVTPEMKTLFRSFLPSEWKFVDPQFGDIEIVPAGQKIEVQNGSIIIKSKTLTVYQSKDILQFDEPVAKSQIWDFNMECFPIQRLSVPIELDFDNLYPDCPECSHCQEKLKIYQNYELFLPHLISHLPLTPCNLEFNAERLDLALQVAWDLQNLGYRVGHGEKEFQQFETEKLVEFETGNMYLYIVPS